MKWKENGQISTVNAQLTFWTVMTNRRDFGGVFFAFPYSRDVSDSETHIQGPK